LHSRHLARTMCMLRSLSLMRACAVSSVVHSASKCASESHMRATLPSHRLLYVAAAGSSWPTWYATMRMAVTTCAASNLRHGRQYITCMYSLDKAAMTSMHAHRVIIAATKYACVHTRLCSTSYGKPSESRAVEWWFYKPDEAAIEELHCTFTDMALQRFALGALQDVTPRCSWDRMADRGGQPGAARTADASASWETPAELRTSATAPA
jgi:hypothetical protein